MLAVGPRVVDLRSGLADHDVLDPVGGRPAGCGAGLQADTPGLGVVGGQAVGGGLQLVPGGRHGAVVGVGVVPDQTLDRGLDEHPVQLLADGAQLDEAG